MIELDRPPAAPASNRPPIRLLRRAGLALAVLLTLACSASVPVESALWQRRGAIPFAAGGAEPYFTVAGDRIYTVDVDGDDGGYRVDAWSADPPRRLWSTRAPAVPELPTGVPSNGIGVTAHGDHLLVSLPTYATVALDPATGGVRWTRPVPVQTTGGGLGVSQLTHFRPGTEYDPLSGEPGQLYWSSDGRPYTEPPRRTTVYGIDLRTGERLWADDEAGSALALPLSDDADAVVVAASGHLVRREVRTGQVVRTAELAGRDPLWVEPVGNLLLVRRGTWDRGGTITAYSAADLTRLWEITDPAGQAPAGDCFGLPCDKDDAGLVVLDPQSGRQLWRVAPEYDLWAWGAFVLELPSTGKGEVTLHERRSGAARDLGVWDEFISERGMPLVLRRGTADGTRSVFGALAPGRGSVQPLGVVDGTDGPCQAGARLVACLGGDGIEVWAYRL